MPVTFNTKNSVSPAIPQIAIYMNQDSYGRLDIADTPPFIIEKLKNKVKATSAAASVSNSRINDPWFKPPTWVASTGYFTGQVVVGLDGVNTYICKDAGTSASSGGPTGSGYSLIKDGTVTWYWNGIVRGLGNATNIVTQDLLSNLLTSIPNARSYQPSLSVPVGYWSGGVVEYDPSSGVTVNVRGPNTATVGSPYYASTPGASFTFITDSTKFILASYNAIYQNITFVVEINDRLLDDSLIYTSAQKNPGGYLFDLSNIPGAVGKFNKIRIISSGGFFTIASKVYIEPSASIYAPQNSNRWSMAVEGDSLTAGGNGTPYHSGLDWVTQVGSMLGCDNAINMAQGGTGFISNRNGAGSTYMDRIQRFASLNADVYVIAGNHNDINYTAGAQTAAALTYFQTLRTLQPNSLIIVFGNNPLQSESSASGSTLYNGEVNLKAAFDQFNDPNSIFVPICTSPNGPWMTGTGSTVSPTNDGNKDKFYIVSDGHPIQRGVNYIAQRYYQELKNALVA